MTDRTTDLWLFRFEDGWHAVPDWDVIADEHLHRIGAKTGPYPTYGEAVKAIEHALCRVGYTWDGRVYTSEDLEAAPA